MRLGIMQPYFFPNLAHFALIEGTDYWVVFDITQYTKKTWISRNRILHPKEGWQYVSVPLEKSTINMRIHEARVANTGDFHRSLKGKLSHYKKTAPFYDCVLEVIDKCFGGMEDDSLVDLNVSGLRCVCDYLGIEFQYQVCSDLNFDYPERMGPGDWAPHISGLLGADTYINPSGGRELFNQEDFESRGIELVFQGFEDTAYPTPGYGYEAGLSILDVMMWNSRDSILSAIEQGRRLG